VIQEALNDVCITQDELVEIDLNAEEFYKPKASSNNEDKVLEDIPDDDDEDKPADKYDNLPPIKIYSALVGYGTGTTWVATRAMCIKSMVKHGKLLNKLLLRMKVNQNAVPNITYIFIGMATPSVLCPIWTLFNKTTSI